MIINGDQHQDLNLSRFSSERLNQGHGGAAGELHIDERNASAAFSRCRPRLWGVMVERDGFKFFLASR
jgi:hypothetical protein